MQRIYLEKAEREREIAKCVLNTLPDILFEMSKNRFFFAKIGNLLSRDYRKTILE